MKAIVCRSNYDKSVKQAQLSKSVEQGVSGLRTIQTSCLSLFGWSGFELKVQKYEPLLGLSLACLLWFSI